jgi:CDP-4-dehydro-6-deoxyglucose reductase, E1
VTVQLDAEVRDLHRLKAEILERVAEYARLEASLRRPFDPAREAVPYAGRVYDEREVRNLVDAALEFWLTAGRWAGSLERRLGRWLGLDHVHLVNSGSSANLLAFMALTSPKLGERRVRRGDEVITVAAGFPTTVAPIVQYGAVPVFVDMDDETVNLDVSRLEAALSPRTRAVMVAHTLGNPFDLDAVLDFCERHGLWLVEDNCDALGARYESRRGAAPEERPTGTFGHLATSSFYPPHHLTTGEGGAVYTGDAQLAALVESFRDWGRDCWCRSGCDNTCGNRFGQRFGLLPHGYDHKFVYSHFGYNLKMTDLQAAVGVAQLDKLDGFVEARRRNFDELYRALAPFQHLLRLPTATPHSRPSWFGFLLRVRPEAPFSRNDLVRHLDASRIATRPLFAGNLLKHPCFDELRERGDGYRVAGDLAVTDALMDDAVWLGVYPGLGEGHLAWVADRLTAFLAGPAAARGAAATGR